MTTEFQGPDGPPWDVDVVADVHAGVYPTEQTAELRRRIAADPQGAAILAALDSTVDGLSLMPPLTMPERFVSRLDAALAAEYTAQSAGQIGVGQAATVRAAPAGSATAGSARAGNGGGADVIRGHLNALLEPGAAQPHPGPQLPRQTGSFRPAHPPRRQPVIPAVLPGGPRLATAGPSSAVEPIAEPGRSNVTDLRQAAAARPADGRPPRAAAPSRPTGPSRLGSLEAQRAKRRRWTGGLLAAAAVVAIGAVTAISLTNNSGTNIAGDASPNQTTVTIQTAAPAPGNADEAPQALVLEPGKLGDSLDQIEGNTTPGGPLANPVIQAACLGANKIAMDDVTGITQVTYQGKPAYAIVVRQDQANTKVDVVVVGEKCGTDGAADTLASQIVTR